MKISVKGCGPVRQDLSPTWKRLEGMLSDEIHIQLDPQSWSPGKFADIDVDGDIMLKVSGSDSEIQIEEDSTLMADGSITMTGDGLGSQVQTKKNVTLKAGGVAGGVGISLTAPGLKSEVQVEENNDFDAVVTSCSKLAPTAS